MSVPNLCPKSVHKVILAHDAEIDDACLAFYLRTNYQNVVTARVCVPGKEGPVLTQIKDDSFRKISGLEPAMLKVVPGEPVDGIRDHADATLCVVSSPTCGLLRACPWIKTVVFCPGAYNGQKSVDEIKGFLDMRAIAPELILIDRTLFFGGKGHPSIESLLADVPRQLNTESAAYAAAITTRNAMGWANIKPRYVFENGPYAGDDEALMQTLWDAGNKDDARKGPYLALLHSKSSHWRVKPKKDRLATREYYQTRKLSGPFGDLAVICGLIGMTTQTAEVERGQLTITERGRSNFYGITPDESGRVFVPRSTRNGMFNDMIASFIETCFNDRY